MLNRQGADPLDEPLTSAREGRPALVPIRPRSGPLMGLAGSGTIGACRHAIELGLMLTLQVVGMTGGEPLSIARLPWLSGGRRQVLPIFL